MNILFKKIFEILLICMQEIKITKEEIFKFPVIVIVHVLMNIINGRFHSKSEISCRELICLWIYFPYKFRYTHLPRYTTNSYEIFNNKLAG